jgi:hypothetical protein
MSHSSLVQVINYNLIGGSQMSEVKSVSEVKEIILAMDSKRKDDLLTQLVMSVFDDFFEDDCDRVEDMLEVIENISGIENLCLFL